MLGRSTAKNDWQSRTVTMLDVLNNFMKKRLYSNVLLALLTGIYRRLQWPTRRLIVGNFHRWTKVSFNLTQLWLHACGVFLESAWNSHNWHEDNAKHISMPITRRLRHWNKQSLLNKHIVKIWRYINCFLLTEWSIDRKTSSFARDSVIYTVFFKSYFTFYFFIFICTLFVIYQHHNQRQHHIFITELITTEFS